MTKHSGKKKRAPAQSGQRRDPDNGRYVRRDQEDNPPPDPPSVPPASADGGDLAKGEISSKVEKGAPLTPHAEIEAPVPPEPPDSGVQQTFEPVTRQQILTNQNGSSHV